MLTSEILENHGYNVINVEEGNHGEIKKRNKCFSALREFTTTLTETQAGGGQSGSQVAASGWKKVLKFGDGVWPPEPPPSWIPDWVTMTDPTAPAPPPRVNRFTPRPPPGPPPGYKAPPQPYPASQPPPPKARPTATPPQGPSASGSQASGSAGPPPHPQAAPKPAPKPMPRRDTSSLEYVPPLTPQHVVTYCRVLTDYTGTQVRSILNSHVSASNDTEFALSHVQGPMANSAQSTWRQYLRRVATYTCLCFGLANARVIGEASYPYSDTEWLRIYNAAIKRGGLIIRTTTSQLGPWWSWWRRTTMHKPLIEATTGGDVDWCRASVEQLLTVHRWENKRMNWQGSSGSARPSWSQTSTTSAKPTPEEQPTSNMDLMNWDTWSPSLTSTASRAWLELRSSWMQLSTWTRLCCLISRPRRMWPSTFGYRLHFSSQILILIMFGLRETTQRGSPRQFEVSTSGRPDRSLYHSARTPDFMAFGRASKTLQWTQPTPWGVLGSWSQLMMGCGDWCMVTPATTTKTSKCRYFYFRHLMKILVVIWTYHRSVFSLFLLIFPYFPYFSLFFLIFTYFFRIRFDYRRCIFLLYVFWN